MREINSTIDKQIESYLNGELNGQELKNVEKMIQNHSNLAEEVAFRQSLRFVVEHKEHFQFNNNVRQVMNNTPIEPDLSTNWNAATNWKNIIGISLSVIAVGVLSWWAMATFTPNTQQQTINALIQEYVEPFENKLHDNSNDNLEQGLIAYDNKNYPLATEQLQRYVNAVPRDTTPQFYLGLSYLLNNQPNEAIPYLQNIINSSDKLMIPHAQWYLGLAYLELGNIQKMKQYFAPIQNNPTYQDKISEIRTKFE